MLFQHFPLLNSQKTNIMLIHRYLPFILLLPFFQPAKVQAQAAQETIQLTCQLEGCTPDFALFQFDGFDFEKIATPQKTDENTYVFRLPKSTPVTYHIGSPKKQLTTILLGSEEGVVMEGTCGKIRSASVKNSKLNDQYISLKKTFQKNEYEMRRLVGELNQAKQDQKKVEKIVAQIGKLDRKKVQLIDSLKKEAPFLAKVAALNTYTSFFHYGQGYANEIEYFANAFFQFADLSDPGFNNTTYVYERFKNYAEILSQVNLSDEKHLEYLNKTVAQIPSGTRAYDYAVGGIMSGLKKKNHPNMITFGNQVIDSAKDKNDPKIIKLQKQIDRAKSFMRGAPAPDFAQKDPEGNERSLSDLKGKIVLIDFWASWCGPCRRENPNVVKLYNKYKDQGFEILGVSLDRDKTRWMKAIKKDKLEWLHISDLKGWKNSAAKLYGVSSIPHTVLVDREGKIIARNLRGATLEQKLAEVFEN